MSWKINYDLTANANFAYQKSKDSNSGSKIPDAPQNQFHINLDWNLINDWKLNTELNYIGSRARSQGDTRNKIENYALTNVYLRKSVNESLNWGLSIRNLFDADEKVEPSNGTIAADLPIEGFSIYSDVSYMF